MLTRMVSISWPHDPLSSASQSAGITGLRHHTQHRRTSLFLPSFHCLSNQHWRASCSVSMKLWGSELVSEFWVLTWLHYGLRDCYDFSCFAFAEEWFTSNYVVSFRVDVMWCWEECIFCGFGVESSINVYQVCLFQVWVQVLDILVNFLSGWSV